MAEHFVADIRDYPCFPDDEGLGKQARHMREFLGGIISAATASPKWRFHSTLQCRMPGRKACGGRLVVRRVDLPPQIHWNCPRCKRSGIVTGWRGSPWDLSAQRIQVESLPPHQLVEIVLSQKSSDVLKELVSLDRECEQILFSAETREDGKVRLRASPDDLEQLLGCVAAEANHADSRPRQRRLDRVLEELEASFEERATDRGDDSGEAAGLFESLPPELQYRVRQLLESRQFASLEEMNQALQQLVLEYNESIRESWAGLSSAQLHRLIQASWDQPDSPVRVSRKVDPGRLQKAPFLYNSRKFLQALEGIGSLRATAAGNLPRVFVARMLQELRFPEGYVELVRSVSKVINEEDVFPLHVVRVVCELAGLVSRRKGKFQVTRRGRELMGKEKARELYARLFTTFFQKFNLAYLDRLPESPGIGACIPFALYRIHRLDRGWRPIPDLAFQLVPPPARAGMSRDLFVLAVNTRILSPLQEFGLVQLKETGDSTSFRKLPLFDELLSFHL